MYYFWTVIDDTFDELATASVFFCAAYVPDMAEANLQLRFQWPECGDGFQCRTDPGLS